MMNELYVKGGDDETGEQFIVNAGIDKVFFTYTRPDRSYFEMALDRTGFDLARKTFRAIEVLMARES